MKLYSLMSRGLLVVWMGLVICSAQAASVSLSTSVPAGSDGVENLSFSTGSADNATVQYVDSEYIAGDNDALGQTFTTGTNSAGYSLSSISVRQVSWGTTYWDYTGGNVTLNLMRMDQDQGNGVWSTTQLALESGAVGGEDDGIGYSSGTPGANAQWLTITLDTAVHLAPNTLYGFVVQSDGLGSNDGFFMQIDGSSTNSYADGFAISTGDINGTAMWDGNNGQPCDRAFVASMTAQSTLPPFYPIQVSPKGDGAVNPVVLEAVVEDWGATFANASLFLDGSAVVIDSTNTVDGVTTVRSSELTLAPDSSHTGNVVVDGASGELATNEWSFTMAPAFDPMVVAPVDAGNATSVVMTATVTDRASSLTSIQLFLDGTPVNLISSNRVGGVTTIGSGEMILDPATEYTGRVVVEGDPVGTTNEWAFSVGRYWSLSNDAVTTASLTNDVVAMDGKSELRLTGIDALSGASVNLKSTDSWVFLEAVKPSDVIAQLDRFRVDGAAAVNGANLKVVQYGQGAVVIPYPSDFQPLEVFSGENFTGDSVLLSPNAAYGAVLGGQASSFILKRGYTATLAAGDGGTEGVNYVAADGDLKIGALPDGLNDQVRYIRVFPWRWATKKGVCDHNPDTFHATWNYNWSINSTSTSDREYVAIRQTRWWPGLNQDWGWRGVSHLLGYNEPNNPVEDAYESLDGTGAVGAAIWSWPDLESTGLRIGAPAVTDGGFGWITEFMDAAQAAGRRVDYIPIHYYRASNNNPSSAASSMYSFLKSVYDRYHLPMWVTEFNNGANWTTATDPTFQQNRDCIEAMINMMDGAPWVERYAIYGAVEETRELIDWSGNITPMGAMYRDHEAPIAYQQIIPGDGMDASAAYSFEGTLDDVSGSGNHAMSGWLDFVPGHSGSAIELNGADDYVVLPDSLSSGTDFTFAAWVNWSGGGAWQRIFDFGIFDASTYMFLTPNNGTGVRFCISTGSGEQTITTASPLPQNTWTHVAVTLSGSTGRLYVNGSQVASGTISANPADLGAIQHYLGRSLFPQDPYFNGELDEVIIQDQAMSSVQIAALAAGNQAPHVVAESVDGGSAASGESYVGSVADAAVDFEGGALSYSKLYGPAWVTVGVDGTLSGTPGATDGGVQLVTVRVTDDAGASAYFTVSIELPDPAGIYIGTSDHPVPGPVDVAQFAASATDAGNVSGGNDAATYISYDPDRGAQGQFFSTPDGPGFELSSLWLKHVPYGNTYSQLSAGDTYKVRIVDPEQINTTNFVLFSETLTVMNGSVVGMPSPGTGRWVEHVLSTPVVLQPGKTYGFDVACEDGGADEFYEISGVGSDVYGGGSAYMSGVDGYGNSSATVYGGDRTFMVELTAVGAPALHLATASGSPLEMSWPAVYGDAFNVLTNSDLSNSNGWGIASFMPVLEGDSYVVTNLVGSEVRLFYKLQENKQHQ